MEANKFVDKEQELIDAVERIFRQTKKNFNIEFWNGYKIEYTEKPEFVLKFNDITAFKRIITNPTSINFAEAYMDKTFDIEGNIFSALSLKNDLDNVELSHKEKLSLFIKANSLSSINKHTKQKDKENISHHYDISNDFYKLFLGESMTYSCAYFKNAADTLTSAQEGKVDHICKKLRLKPGEKLLDVGCGWGAMIIWAAKHYGVTAHGITISKEQYEYVKEKIKFEKLESVCSVEFKDYRELEGEEVYDKIVSIGMFEHVGIKNLSSYFTIMNRLLKNNGLFLNHGITHAKNVIISKDECDFIDKYIFPGGELHTISGVLSVMEDTNYEVFDVECLREHYYKTLSCWVENLQESKNKAIEYTSERTFRTWLLYMAGCAINFESGFISVYQVLLGKNSKQGGFNIPLTREYIYNPE